MGGGGGGRWVARGGSLRSRGRRRRHLCWESPPPPSFTEAKGLRGCSSPPRVVLPVFVSPCSGRLGRWRDVPGRLLTIALTFSGRRRLRPMAGPTSLSASPPGSSRHVGAISPCWAATCGRSCAAMNRRCERRALAATHRRRQHGLPGAALAFGDAGLQIAVVTSDRRALHQLVRMRCVDGRRRPQGALTARCAIRTSTRRWPGWRQRVRHDLRLLSLCRGNPRRRAIPTISGSFSSATVLGARICRTIAATRRSSSPPRHPAGGDRHRPRRRTRGTLFVLARCRSRCSPHPGQEFAPPASAGPVRDLDPGELLSLSVLSPSSLNGGRKPRLLRRPCGF